MIRSNIKNMCLEEYKIIQAKIDKIGEFKFKVRGWSFTILSAALAGLFTHDLPPVASSIFFPALTAVVFFFNLIELEQVSLVSALSVRAAVLEKTLNRLSLPSQYEDESVFMRLLMKELQGTPRIAVTLRNEARQNKTRLLKGVVNYRTNLFFCFQYFVLILGDVAYLIHSLYNNH